MIVVNIKAQKPQFLNNSFIKKTETKLSSISSEEKKFQAVTILQSVSVEFITDSISNNFSKYYCIYKRVHINDAAAIDMYNKIAFPLGESSELYDLKFTSISPSGAIKTLGKESVKEITEEGNTFKMLAVEGLEVGSELDYYYILKTGVNIYGSENIKSKSPIREFNFNIYSPEKLKFLCKLYNYEGIKIDTVISDIAQLGYKLNNIIPLNDEKYSAGNANQPYILFILGINKNVNNNKVFSWKDAGKNIFDNLNESSKNSKTAVSKLIKKEKLQGQSELETIKLIENYIKTNIALNEQSGDMLPDEVIKAKFGSESNISRLFTALFTETRVNYETVVGCDRSTYKFDKTFETWSPLDHFLFYFPEQKMFLDPDNQMLRLGQFSDGMEGTDALFISNITLGDARSGLPRIKKIDFTDQNQNFNNINAEVSFSVDLSEANISFNNELSGSQAGEIKGYLHYCNEKQKNEVLENILKSTFKEDVNIKKAEVFNYDLNSPDYAKPIVFKSQISLKSMMEKAGNKVIFKLGEIIGPQQELYNENERQQDIDIRTKHLYQRIILVKIPKNVKVKGLEDINKNIVYNPNGIKTIGFVSKYEMVPEGVKITIDEYYNEVLFSKNIYNDFQKVINASADFNKVTLILEIN